MQSYLEVRIVPKKMFDFPRGVGRPVRAVVYVPSTIRDKPVSEEVFQRRIRETQNYLSKLLGGSTQVFGEGTWIEDKAGLIKEKVAKVTAFAKSKDYDREDLKLEAWLNRKREEWGQWSLSFEFESPTHRSSRLYFIEKPKAKERLREEVL